jgi:hypothetical protein
MDIMGRIYIAAVSHLLSIKAKTFLQGREIYLITANFSHINPVIGNYLHNSLCLDWFFLGDRQHSLDCCPHLAAFIWWNAQIATNLIPVIPNFFSAL